ncbi:integrase core domain-containing protein [Herpetosiphon llansteffanensis]
MADTDHPQRVTAFERMVHHLGYGIGAYHAERRGRNGFIERSNRTDTEEWFQRQQFVSSEERRYEHRLWEMSDNTRLLHQGLGGETPAAVRCTVGSKPRIRMSGC